MAAGSKTIESYRDLISLFQSFVGGQQARDSELNDEERRDILASATANQTASLANKVLAGGPVMVGFDPRTDQYKGYAAVKTEMGDALVEVDGENLRELLEKEPEPSEVKFFDREGEPRDVTLLNELSDPKVPVSDMTLVTPGEAEVLSQADGTQGEVKDSEDLAEEELARSGVLIDGNQMTPDLNRGADAMGDPLERIRRALKDKMKTGPKDIVEAREIMIQAHNLFKNPEATDGDRKLALQSMERVVDYLIQLRASELLMKSMDAFEREEGKAEVLEDMQKAIELLKQRNNPNDGLLTTIKELFSNGVIYQLTRNKWLLAGVLFAGVMAVIANSFLEISRKAGGMVLERLTRGRMLYMR